MEIDIKKVLGDCYYDEGLNYYQNKDYTNALISYFKAAEEFNHDGAQLAIGRIYKEGERVGASLIQALREYEQTMDISNSNEDVSGSRKLSSDLFKALKWYELSLTNGNETAMYYAGCLLCDGVEIGPEDPKKGFHYLLQLANKGHTDAQCKVGNCYEVGIGVSKDIESAKYWYEKAADSSTAQFRLGLMYRDGNGVEQNYTEARLWLEKAATLDMVESSFIIGQLYEEGLGVDENDREASIWYEKSARLGHVKSIIKLAKFCEKNTDFSQAMYWFTRAGIYGDNNAQLEVGDCYRLGNGVDVNHEMAVKWYTSAHENGNHLASFSIALVYNQGIGVEKNLEKCLYWLKKYDHLEKHHDGLYKMAELYYKGDDVERDYKEALGWYKRAVSNTDVDNEDHMFYMHYTIADMYYNGEYGVKQDFKKAMKWYITAHDHGSSLACIKIAVMYNQGYGVEKNLEQCLYWLKTYDNLSKDNNGFYEMAEVYHKGRGVEKNYKETLTWYERVIENTNIDSDKYLNYIYYTMAFIYNTGEFGVERNLKKEIYYLELAAEREDDDALYRLGMHYYLGSGVERNYQKSMEYITRAADRDHVLSLIHTALAYKSGTGVERDFKKTMQYYLKAAELGSGDAMNEIGDMYENGQGVGGIGKDYNKAIEWYQKAIDAGSALGYTSMGNLYRLGLGVTQDPKVALKWYEKALECDVSDYGCANYCIGLLHSSGFGVDQNDGKAFEYFMKAAQEDNYLVCENLGDAYRLGRGTEQNHTEALRWYTKGSDANSESCLFNLGKMYLNGLGTEPNMEVALEWYQKAHELGNKEAYIEILQIEMRKLRGELLSGSNSGNDRINISASSLTQVEIQQKQKSNIILSMATPPSILQTESLNVSVNKEALSPSNKEQQFQFFHLNSTQADSTPSLPETIASSANSKLRSATKKEEPLQFFYVPDASPMAPNEKDTAAVEIEAKVSLQFFSV